MVEVWKDIPGYEGYYQVSNFGRIMSLRSYGGNEHKLLTPCGNGTGYLKVMLCKDRIHKQFLIHRLVAMAFIPNPDNCDFVNHKDEDKTNNVVDNLEWCTKSYNSVYYLNFDPRRKKQYAKRFLDKNTGELTSPRTKHIPVKYFRKIYQKDINGNIICIHENASIIKKEMGYSTGNIIFACKENEKRENTGRKKRTAFGYIWEFAE